MAFLPFPFVCCCSAVRCNSLNTFAATLQMRWHYFFTVIYVLFLLHFCSVHPAPFLRRSSWGPHFFDFGLRTFSQLIAGVALVSLVCKQTVVLLFLTGVNYLHSHPACTRFPALSERVYTISLSLMPALLSGNFCSYSRLFLR